MHPPFPYFGEILALSTACVWAFAVILFKKSGETAHPLALNLFKSLLGVALFLLTMALTNRTIFRAAPVSDYALLLVSGALGIGIADTLFFMSLNTLGAALSSIVDCAYSPIIIGLSILWLGESLSLWQMLGVALIVSAVVEATLGKRPAGLTRGRLGLGIFLGIAAMASMGIGIVSVKPLLERSPLMWAAEIRLLGGVLTLLLILLLHPQRRAILGSLTHTRGWGYVLPGSFLGAYVSLILWMGGMKYAQASVAAGLNQTSNIFVFIFAALFLREPITRTRTLAIVLGMIGAYLVTFG
jgi:drug/metabolite transporter (DMT)-like permease